MSRRIPPNFSIQEKPMHHLVSALFVLMEEEGIDVEELSRRAGLSHSTIRAWRRKGQVHRRLYPRIDALDKAFHALGYQLTFEPIYERQLLKERGK